MNLSNSQVAKPEELSEYRLWETRNQINKLLHLKLPEQEEPHLKRED
jgi:hypothetical protein